MVQFFLKHDALIDLLNYYGTNSPGLHKGLVFSVDFKLEIVQFGTPPISKPEYLAKARIWGVEGPYVDESGILTEMPGTSKIPCPHPPPCSFNLQGNYYEIVGSISDVAIADCYPQGQ